MLEKKYLSAGLDLKSQENKILKPGKRCLINTGFRLNINYKWQGEVRSRSGLALKYGIAVLNSPGTIDSDYKDEIKVILINHGEKEFHIKKGYRIAQLIISRNYAYKFFKNFPYKKRKGGFGSSGIV